MSSSRSQEVSTLEEEIGIQEAIVRSLAHAQDAESKMARINARREKQLLEARLQQLGGSPSRATPQLGSQSAMEPEQAAHPLSGPPATPRDLPSRKRDHGHGGSPPSPGMHSKSRKTTPMSSAPNRAPSHSIRDALNSDNLEVIDLTGDDLSDTSGYIAAQIRQEKLAAQGRRDRGLAQSLQRQPAARSEAARPLSESRDPRSDPLQRLMVNARTNGVPKAGFHDEGSSGGLTVEFPAGSNGIHNPAWAVASGTQYAEEFLRQKKQRDEEYRLQSLRQMEKLRAARETQRLQMQRLQMQGRLPQQHPGMTGVIPGTNLPVTFPGYKLPGAYPELRWPVTSSGSGFAPTSQYGPIPSVQAHQALKSATWPTVPSMGSSSANDMKEVIKSSNEYSYSASIGGFGHPPMPDRMSHFLGLNQDQQNLTEKELEELLGNIQPDFVIPPEERQGKVEGLKVNTYYHQQLALKWMQAMEDGSNKGGILADDMGLGKTISTLALMVTRRATSRPKTNLIISPLALIRQWEEEINNKVSASHKLSVFVYHNKKVTTEELLTYDVVLTTYGTIAAELKRLEKFTKENMEAGRSADFAQREIAIKFPLLHPTKAKYHRVILDEAQCIKNRKTQTAKACHRLRATYRWCLTGTPMMNGVLELFSLLAFLHIRPYSAWESFRKQFGSLFGSSGGDGKTTAMNTLRALLKAILLRRKKNSLLDGKPILTLPKKTEQVVYAELSSDERDFYNQLELKAQVLFSKYLREGSVGKNYSHILVLLLRLRQACCHPHLNLDVDDAVPVTEGDVLELVKKLQPSIVTRIKEANGFECPICYDAVFSPQFFIPCGHDSCGQCLLRLMENATSTNIQEGHESDKCKCPVCREPFNPKQCFSLEAFQKVHMPEALKAEPEDEFEDESEDESEDETDEDVIDEADAEDDIYSDDTVDGNGNLANFVVDDHFFSESEDEMDTKPDVADFKPEVKPEVKAEGSSSSSGLKSEEDEDEKEKLRKAMIKNGKRAQPIKTKKPKKSKTKKDKKVIKSDIKPSMLKELRIQGRKSREAYRKYMNYLRENWLPSAKVSECIRLLREAEEQGRKSIVFSQWTLLLDLIEVCMDHDGFCNKPKRYDGGMSGDERNCVAKAFQDERRRDVTVMLVSLRAGNAGLNLTQATRVIIMDPFWNPYIEMQAVDRAYRIGQTQEVEVFRILTKETVEDRIVDLKEKKQAIVEAALDEAESAKIGRLGVNELKFLFNRRDE